MESSTKTPKTLMRSVLDAFRGTSNDGPGSSAEVDGLEQEPYDVEINNEVAAMDAERSSILHGVDGNGRIGFGKMHNADATDSELPVWK